MDRRKAREYTFIIIFQYKFQPDEIDTILEDFFSEYDAGRQSEYIKQTVTGVVRNIDEIDSKITEYAKGWTADRIGAVSLAALRLGFFEMLYADDMPLAVSANEAANITRKYAGAEAVAFVNGVLGGLQKRIQEKQIQKKQIQKKRIQENQIQEKRLDEK